jgi:hypothetical protein
VGAWEGGAAARGTTHLPRAWSRIRRKKMSARCRSRRAVRRKQTSPSAAAGRTAAADEDRRRYAMGRKCSWICAAVSGVLGLCEYVEV